MQLTTRLLSQMKDTMPGPVVTELFNQIAEDMASHYSSDMRGLSMEERLNFVKEMLGREGFTVEWEKKGGQYEIHEISCPYYQIGVCLLYTSDAADERSSEVLGGCGII